MDSCPFSTEGLWHAPDTMAINIPESFYIYSYFFSQQQKELFPTPF
jgi:hypothetical protein